MFFTVACFFLLLSLKVGVRPSADRPSLFFLRPPPPPQCRAAFMVVH